MKGKRRTSDTSGEEGLSRRETQIMQALYRHGPSTAADVRAALPDPPGYSTVRKLLEILEQKQRVVHSVDGTRYVYRPMIPVEKASRSALHRVVSTFFSGSHEQAVEALFDLSDREIGDEALARLEGLIKKARRKKRPV